MLARQEQVPPVQLVRQAEPARGRVLVEPAQLAGAMGKKTWVLLPSVSDFRWFIDRQDSPWYPTMRLYRQQVRGDWGGGLERGVVDLREMAAAC